MTKRGGEQQHKTLDLCSDSCSDATSGACCVFADCHGPVSLKHQNPIQMLKSKQPSEVLAAHGRSTYTNSEKQPQDICSYMKQLRSGREAGGQQAAALGPLLYITTNEMTAAQKVYRRAKNERRRPSECARKRRKKTAVSVTDRHTYINTQTGLWKSHLASLQGHSDPPCRRFLLLATSALPKQLENRKNDPDGPNGTPAATAARSFFLSATFRPTFHTFVEDMRPDQCVCALVSPDGSEAEGQSQVSGA